MLYLFLILKEFLPFLIEFVKFELGFTEIMITCVVVIGTYLTGHKMAAMFVQEGMGQTWDNREGVTWEAKSERK